ncbi:hypothetical protein [Dermacoccus nishinomiyaensis]|uniref:hypothetical protein n=1 Tax=Dermacoccus nishinomiyaensis TaxID=1274 RepID=UPI001F510A32|nr:hypothetical protein [Dermacoccus nishinomiyaensis]MCI0155065.1 hypothetical protein [Dermacoccus nishinomiyaensis]
MNILTKLSTSAAAVAAATTLIGTTAAPVSSAATEHKEQTQITFYGGPDNDPAGSTAIKYPRIHTRAGGIGTYADPITFAAPNKTFGWLQPGTKIYVPKMHKYFVMEDSCAACNSLWKRNPQIKRVDLWAGAHASAACEAQFTGDARQLHTIIVDPDPSKGRQVDTRPIC